MDVTLMIIVLAVILVIIPGWLGIISVLSRKCFEVSVFATLAMVLASVVASVIMDGQLSRAAIVVTVTTLSSLIAILALHLWDSRNGVD